MKSTFRAQHKRGYATTHRLPCLMGVDKYVPGNKGIVQKDIPQMNLRKGQVVTILGQADWYRVGFRTLDGTVLKLERRYLWPTHEKA